MVEPWLRGEGECCLRGPQGQCMYNITVNDLMLTNDKQWDVHKIRHLFTHKVVKEILKVTPDGRYGKRFYGM